MVFSPDKCSFMLLGVDDKLQTNLACGKVLGITFDNKLNFAMHLSNITKNANIKFNTLTIVQKCMAADKKNLIFSLFIKSQFTLCPLIWMFCRKHSIS